ncbi:hypothetical protein BU16DRAFT_290771 [Lophium mytilinum]|uniref:Uncharacterized protein n=1 Tax=Lophium mytilinum TaxID=390894 RepID=A0A6A6R0Q7_9PEZI|nr:hypothetical protein BU16DRAFT_290771 [Lophium mytilinum]
MEYKTCSLMCTLHFNSTVHRNIKNPSRVDSMVVTGHSIVSRVLLEPFQIHTIPLPPLLFRRICLACSLSFFIPFPLTKSIRILSQWKHSATPSQFSKGIIVVITSAESNRVTPIVEKVMCVNCHNFLGHVLFLKSGVVEDFLGVCAIRDRPAHTP